jgi:FK506-binding protein 2
MKLFLCLCLLIVLINAKSKYDTGRLQVGIKFRPEVCEIKTKDGDTVSVHYKGTLTDGTKFDSSYDRNDPFSFLLGAGQVIKGWDLGMLGACVGEKRKLVIPSDMGYGDHGSPPKIPGKSTLLFEVEIMKIN